MPSCPACEIPPTIGLQEFYGRSKMIRRSGVEGMGECDMEPTHDGFSGGTHGRSLWWELEVNGVEEGTIDLPLKWKLTATEEAAQQFDSKNMAV